MAIVDRKISSFELRQSTRSKLLSSKLVESKSIVKKARRKSERRYFTNTDYLNSQDGASPSDSPSKSSKRRKTERDTAVRGVSTRRSKGKVVSSETDGRESESDWLERVHGMRRSPIVTSQGYHLYTHLIIESKDERDVFTVGDHVMVCLSGGGERPAQITAFLYDPEEDLQGVELRWFYSEHDLLDLGKIIDKSKLPEGLFAFEEEFLESDKCEVLEASVIKRMIRIWNVKREYLRWSRDYLGIYSGPQRCRPGERLSESRHHDERLEDYIREFNADLPSYSVEVSDNFLALYLVLTDTGTIVPIQERRDVSHLLSRCSTYYGYYVNHLAIRLSPGRGRGVGPDVHGAGGADLHWSSRPRKVLPCREKEHEEIVQVLKTSILNEGGGVLFVAGLPGTGKTATVLNTLDMLETEMNLSNKNEGRISVCYINALHLSSPDHFYRTFLQKLNGANTWAPNKEACYSSLDRYFKARGSPVTILVIDEIDWLQKNGASHASLEGPGNSLLYTLIDWPFQKNTKLIIIAIANTMDLPERLIPRCTSRCGYARVNFTPFSVDDMITILNDRVQHFSAGTPREAPEAPGGRRTSPRIRNKRRSPDLQDEQDSLFCSKAVEFCARRISQQSSDVRRALQVLHRAWEICKHEFDSRDGARPRSGKRLQVQIPHVQAACREVLLSNVAVSLVDTLPLPYKVFLAALVLELESKHKSLAPGPQDEAESPLEEDDPSPHLDNYADLLKVEKRTLTILSLAGYEYLEYLDSAYIKTMTRKLVSSRIIQTLKGEPLLDTNATKSNQDLGYQTHLFGADVCVSLLVDAPNLRSFLEKNLPIKVKGLER